MTVEVCIGSACHLKGSYPVIQTLKSLLEQEALEDKVQLKVSFCMGTCVQGVSVRIDDRSVYSVSPETAYQFFQDHIKGE